MAFTRFVLKWIAPFLIASMILLALRLETGWDALTQGTIAVLVGGAVLAALRTVASWFERGRE